MQADSVKDSAFDHHSSSTSASSDVQQTEQNTLYLVKKLATMPRLLSSTALQSCDIAPAAVATTELDAVLKPALACRHPSSDPLLSCFMMLMGLSPQLWQMSPKAVQFLQRYRSPRDLDGGSVGSKCFEQTVDRQCSARQGNWHANDACVAVSDPAYRDRG